MKHIKIFKLTSKTDGMVRYCATDDIESYISARLCQQNHAQFDGNDTIPFLVQYGKDAITAEIVEEHDVVDGRVLIGAVMKLNDSDKMTYRMNGERRKSANLAPRTPKYKSARDAYNAKAFSYEQVKHACTTHGKDLVIKSLDTMRADEFIAAYL